MAIERVHYFDRQFLRVEDFADEQAYHIAMRRRHNISHHTWGIVQGLEPQFADGSLWLTPGIAIDGFGRELISDHVQRLGADLFDGLQVDQLEVWIYYSTRRTSQAAGGYAPLRGEPRYYRLTEQIRIELLRSNPNSTARRPDEVLATDVRFDATRTPPEDRIWPVFLGTISANPNNPAHPYSVDLSDRPYVGLVGETVVAPSGGARVQIGAEQADDANRFAVFVPATDTEPRLAILENGQLIARGETTVQGNVNVSGGALEIGAGQVVTAQPWRIYRVAETGPNGVTRSELRVEMQGESGGNNQIVFGAWSQKESKFKPCLTIADDGNVTVSGNLVVQGKLEAPTGGVVAGTAEPTPEHLQHIREFAEKIAHPGEEHLKAFAAMVKKDFHGVGGRLKQLLQE